VALGSTFEAVTKVAIGEIIAARAKSSKFGYVLSHEDYELLINDLFGLLLNSRSLKTAGDKFLRSPPSDDPMSRRK
jgi:hypothetical protein